MDVEASLPGRLKKLLWQDLSVSDHDRNVSVVRCEQLVRVVIPDFLRLMNCEVVLEGESFHRRLLKLLSATAGFVRLRPDSGDLMTVIDEPSQRRHCRFWCTHEDDAHENAGAELVPARYLKRNGQAQGLPLQQSRSTNLRSRFRLRLACASRRLSLTTTSPA